MMNKTSEFVQLSLCKTRKQCQFGGAEQIELVYSN